MHNMETETQTQVAKKFASLAEKRPDLAKEWDYEKNGGLRPAEVLKKFGGCNLSRIQ